MASNQQRLRFRRRLWSVAALGAAAIFMAQTVSGQLIYTEDFNTDGDGTRYTTRGRGLVLLSIEGNQEPSYWTHSSDVTKAGEVVGVVVPAAGRRAALTFQSAVPEALLTPDGLKLIDNTIKWLTGDKKGKVVMSPSAAGEGDLLLSARMTAAGYTVADDDTAAALPDAATVALAISTSGGITPTRFTRYGAPMLSFNASNHDDELLTSIGASNSSFDPGTITIADAAHPIAAGLPKTFQFVTEAVGLDTLGSTLPEKAKVIATYKFLNPDTNLEETRPLLIVVEKADGLLGGPFKGFEGAGFWAGADMNEPTVTPDCCNTADDPRQLTLKAVSVSGKKDVRVTIALAATDIDFENSDFLRVMIDPDGAGPAEFTQIVNFTPPTANDKFFTDPAGNNRLAAVFRDVEFKISDGATDLVVRIEAISTFFNEIVGFDNIRIHSGPLVVTPPAPALGGVESVKLTHIVSDTILFKTANENLDNWEPHASVLGNSTFLIEANTFADGSTDSQRFSLAFQPAAGGAAKFGEVFFSDDGKPFTGKINASRQNGNPGRVAGDKRPGAVNIISGGEASPHTVAAFGSDARWTLGYNRTRDDGVESRYGTVQIFKFDGTSQTSVSKAIDVANGRLTTGQTPSDQTTRFGGDIMALDNGNFVAAVEDRSKVRNPDGNAAVATVIAPNGSVVKETFAVANGDLWANLAAYKGGFAVRVAGIIYFFDNAGNPKGQVDPADSTIGFDRGRGDGTRLAGHINSPFVYLAGTVTDTKDDGSPIKVPYLAAFDSRDQKFTASIKVGDIDGDSDRVNLAVDALNRVTVAYEGKPTDYEQFQMMARVIGYDAAAKKFTALTPGFFPFKNNSKTGITARGPSVAVTTKQILIAGKGTLNSQNKPDLGPDTTAKTTVYVVISHPAPAEDPTPAVIIDGPADVATGLVGYWPMNETTGTVVPDSSGKGHNGAIINSPTGTWVTDAERGAVYKSTGTSVISFGELIPPMTTANDFTWSLWLKSDETGTAAAANNNTVFGNRYNSKGADFSPREFIKFTPSNFEWHFNAAGQNVDYTDFVVGKWTHHVVVKKGTALTYYRDGVEAKAGKITGGPKNAQPLYLGGQGTQERWKGAADEVAIYDRALSATDVKQAFDLGKANQPLVAPPVTPPQGGTLTPASATFYINTPDTINNGKTESMGVAVAANGNVLVGWEDDGDGLKDQEAVWTLFDSTGKGLTKEVTFKTTQGADTLTSKFLAYFRADKSPVAGNNAWGPKIKANLFGDGIGMGGTAYSLGLEIPELGPVNLQANGEGGDFPAVQLLNNDGSPVNVLAGVTDAYADRDGDIRIGDWDYLSNGNVVIVGESRQKADLMDVYKGAEAQNHAIYRIVDSTGKEITAEDKVSEVAEKAEIWHGVGVTKSGFAVRFASSSNAGTVRLFDNTGKPITGNIDLATLAGAGAEAAGAGGRGDGAGFHGNGNDAYVAISSSGAIAQVTVIGADGKLRYTRNAAEGADIASIGRVDAAIDAAGNVLAVFPAKATADGSVSLIYGRLLDPTGKPLTDVFLVSETEVPGKATADATDPRVAMRGGVAAVIWESKNQGTGDPSVVASRFFKFGSAVVGGEKPTIATVKIVDANLVLTWTGGQGPFKVQRRDDIGSGTWADVSTVNERTASVPATGIAGFFRITGQ